MVDFGVGHVASLVSLARAWWNVAPGRVQKEHATAFRLPRPHSTTVTSQLATSTCVPMHFPPPQRHENTPPDIDTEPGTMQHAPPAGAAHAFSVKLS